MRPPRFEGPLRFAALGDSLTEGVGDPVGDRVGCGWAALLAHGLTEEPVDCTHLAVSGSQTGTCRSGSCPPPGWPAGAPTCGPSS
jgi:lysophospholipase L1-like esterase